MHPHPTPLFHPAEGFAPVIVAILFILAFSLLTEPARRNFMAIMIAGAGAAYLSGGGLGKWEFVFTAVITFLAYRGLGSYRYIGAAWLLHTAWDLVHHFYGNPIVPFLPDSSAACAICDAVLAIWFFANAPSVFELGKSKRSGDPTQAESRA